MKKTGIVAALNVSPKGFYDGFLLKTKKETIQINLPGGSDRDGGGDVVPEAGSRLTVDVEPEEPHGEPAHEVFRLVRKHGGHQFAGRIASLNYALHGEVNGGILDSGDFLHVKPHGAKALGLKVGLNVAGFGKTKPMTGDKVVIEAVEVNGIAVREGKAKRA